MEHGCRYSTDTDTDAGRTRAVAGLGARRAMSPPGLARRRRGWSSGRLVVLSVLSPLPCADGRCAGVRQLRADGPCEGSSPHKRLGRRRGGCSASFVHLLPAACAKPSRKSHLLQKPGQCLPQALFQTHSLRGVAGIGTLCSKLPVDCLPQSLCVSCCFCCCACACVCFRLRLLLLLLLIAFSPRPSALGCQAAGRWPSAAFSLSALLGPSAARRTHPAAGWLYT